MYNLFKLDNGLRVAVESINYVNSISVGLWVENGSRNENIYNNGISHFIEHMLFKGTYNKTAKEIVETIENVGGQINAFTGKEATCFYIKALDTHLELALELISDMLFNSKYSEEDIEKEKNVVIEEINMNEDTPEDVLSDLHCRAIWDNDSLALPILGSINTVKSFSRDQIKNYVSSYYVPEKSVISICGKFDMKKIESLVIKYFGNWVCDNKKLTDYSSPMFSNKCLFKEKNIEQLHISLGLLGMETGNDDIYALLLLNNMLGGGASSQLFQKIREEKGMCYSIYSYLSSFKNTGAIIVYAGLNPDNAVDAVNQIKNEIEEFSVSSISDEKLIKAKEQLKGNYILGLESTSSRMFSNGKYVLFLDKILTPEEIIKKVDDVNIDKLYRVMDSTFKQGIKNSAFVGENFDVDKLKIILEGDTIAFKNQKSTRI